MARKKTSHRPNLPTETLNRARQQAGQDTVVPAARPARQKNKLDVDTSVKKVTMEDLANEYAYVVTDLRNMGLLAAALFALLIVLSFVL